MTATKHQQEQMPGTQQHISVMAVVNRLFKLIFVDEPAQGQRPNVQASNQLLSNASVVSEKDKRLSLVFEDLNEFPFSLVKKYSAWIRMVDLSHNRFSNVQFLEHFDYLDTVILDHNFVSRASSFPRLPSLKTLWLNYNKIKDLDFFLDQLASKCPNLSYLSLMGNPSVASSLSGDSQPAISRYRLKVITYFPNLRYLDDRSVSQLELDAVQQLTESRRLSVSQVFGTISSFVESRLDRRQIPRYPSNGVV